MDISHYIQQGVILTDKLTRVNTGRYLHLSSQWNILEHKWSINKNFEKPPRAILSICQQELLEAIFSNLKINNCKFYECDTDELNLIITTLNNSLSEWFNNKENAIKIITTLPTDLQHKINKPDEKKKNIFISSPETYTGTGSSRKSWRDYGIGGTEIPIEANEGFVKQSQEDLKPTTNENKVAEESLPAKGKILYDIAENMEVNKQYKCIIRIAKDEVIAKDDDAFTSAVKIENISLSGTMRVELIDVAEPQHFCIKTINSPEQEVDSDSFTEWLFWVIPFEEGVYDLILKVSIIKVANGKEKRKDIVFQKSINISTNVPVRRSFFGSEIDSKFKNLANEKEVTIIDSPNVFISYAHKDKVYFDIFLDNLRSQSAWNIWTDKNIEIGSNWFERIKDAINNSNFAVLLISSDFLSSSFIKQNEFADFLKLGDEKKNFIFLPILLRDVDFTRWEKLAARQFFVAYGDEYGIPEYKGKMIPFAKLCRFDNNNQLIPNDEIDTYFKNFVLQTNKQYLPDRLHTPN